MLYHTLPVICCITSLTPRIKIYGRLFCNHLKRYRNSEKELLPWSPYSVSLSSGCLASLWEWLRKRLCTHPCVQLWTPDLVFLELGFSAHSLGRELIWIWTSPEKRQEASPVSLVWTHWEAKAFSLPAAPEGLCSWLQLACMALEYLFCDFFASGLCLLKNQRAETILSEQLSTGNMWLTRNCLFAKGETGNHSRWVIFRLSSTRL